MTIVKLRGEWETKKVWLNGELLDHHPSLKVWNHSPAGFAWGYGGSGPAQLAFAVLLKFTDRRTANCNHQDFKWEIIAQLAPADFDVEINLGPWIAGRDRHEAS